MVENPATAYETIIRLLAVPRRVPPSSHDNSPDTDWVTQESIDWEQVWQIADKARVTPLLHQTTRKIPGLPDWWREGCQAAYQKTGIINTLRFQELKALLADLREAGLGVIVLKGIALIELIYGNPAVRPMVDMDLLLRKHDIPQAIEIMAGRDYRVSGGEIAPGSALAYENEILIRKQGPYGWQIELHWNLFNSTYYQRRLPEDEWWRTAVAITIDREQTLCLSPEWMLIHLCGHLAFHHHGQGLLWWHDLAALLWTREGEIDWDYVLIQAQAANMVLPLQDILPRLAMEWNVPILLEILTRLREIVPEPVEIEMQRASAEGVLSPGQRMLVDAKGLESWPKKARFLIHNVLPSATYMDARYGISHPLIRPFYYPYRWLLGLSGFLHDTLHRWRDSR